MSNGDFSRITSVDALTSVPTSKEHPKNKVDLWSLSFFKSNIGKFLFISLFIAAVTAAVIIALPSVAAAAGVVIPACVVTALKITAGVTCLVLLFCQRKRIFYDMAILSNVLRQSEERQWWSDISKDVILGAIPCLEHLPALKELGVTHIMTFLEAWECEDGIVSPIIESDLAIVHHVQHAVDFEGVSVDVVSRAVNLMKDARETNSKAKFYIHCKSGVGRSTSIVIADQIYQKMLEMSPEERIGINMASLVDDHFSAVKKERDHINLNSNQKIALVVACDALRTDI